MHTQDFPEMGWLGEETTLKGAPHTPKYFDLQSKHKVATSPEKRSVNVLCSLSLSDVLSRNKF